MRTRICAPSARVWLPWKSGGMTMPTRACPAMISRRASCGFAVTRVMSNVCDARIWSMSSRLAVERSWSTTTVGRCFTVWSMKPKRSSWKTGIENAITRTPRSRKMWMNSFL